MSKMARIAHLDIWNTSYGQKKAREFDSRDSASFDSRPLNVKNRPEILRCRKRVTYRWKGLDETYSFALDGESIGGLLRMLWSFKVAGVPGVPGQNGHLDATPATSHRVYYKGEGGGFPQGPGRGESCVSVLPVACPNTKGIQNEL
jgi:hypothetical protein